MTRRETIQTIVSDIDRRLKKKFPGITTVSSVSSASISGGDAHLYVYTSPGQDPLRIHKVATELSSKHFLDSGVWVLTLVEEPPEGAKDTQGTRKDELKRRS